MNINEAIDGIVQHVARVVKERDELRERFEAEHETLARVVKERNALHRGLEVIRDSFWSENEPYPIRVSQLQNIARDTLKEQEKIRAEFAARTTTGRG